MQNINRSGLHACCPQTMRNLAFGNTKQSFCLFSNALQCPEERHSISHQTGSANCAVRQSQSSWRRWSYDWPSLSQTNSWGQLGCIFRSSQSCLLSICTISEHLFSFQYTQLVDQHAHRSRKTPDFEPQKFFGQLNRILLLELPSAQRLNLDEPTTVIVALIRGVKTTLRNGIYYYKIFGVDEIVDLDTLQCVVGRIWDRDEWAIIDRSDNVDIQGD